QIFHRQVIDALGVALRIGLLCPEPALRDEVSQRVRRSLPPIVRVGIPGVDDPVENQMPLVQRIIGPGELDRAAILLAKCVPAGIPGPAPSAEAARSPDCADAATTGLFANNTTTERGAARYVRAGTEGQSAHGEMSAGDGRAVSIHRRQGLASPVSSVGS